MIKKYFIFNICLLLIIIAKSQTQYTLDSLKKVNQACLDSGIGMTGCAGNYYQQMDSLLNVVYKKLYARSNSSAKLELKKEQLQWLKERDRSFKKISDENKKEAQKDEMLRHFNTMFNLQEEADFVQKQVAVLIKRLKS